MGERGVFHQDPIVSKVRLISEHKRPDVRLEGRENERIRERLCCVVKKAGEKVLDYKGPISDTGTSHGHDLSIIDEYARSIINNALEEAFPNKHYVGRFELRPVGVRPYEEEKPSGKVEFYAAVDEIDGTTNTKRELANLKYGDVPRPQAATCIAICRSKELGSVQVGAAYTYDTRDTYSAFRAGDSFFSFKNDILLRESDYSQILGDSKPRLLLAAYSNLNTSQEEKWKSALKRNIGPTYEGCRASSIDIINIIRGRSDAYIDGRALWGERNGAMLQAYDIAAVIPIALGLGFSVSDVYGEPWQKYKINDSIPLVISRSQRLHEEILKTINPLLPERG